MELHFKETCSEAVHTWLWKMDWDPTDDTCRVWPPVPFANNRYILWHEDAVSALADLIVRLPLSVQRPLFSASRHAGAAIPGSGTTEPDSFKCASCEPRKPCRGELPQPSFVAPPGVPFLLQTRLSLFPVRLASRGHTILTGKAKHTGDTEQAIDDQWLRSAHTAVALSCREGSHALRDTRDKIHSLRRATGRQEQGDATVIYVIHNLLTAALLAPYHA